MVYEDEMGCGEVQGAFWRIPQIVFIQKLYILQLEGK